MTIEPEHTPAEAERNPAPFRASLLATTTIPTLGKTFGEAAEQTRALLAGYPTVPGDDEAAQEAQGREWQQLHDAILGAPARTFGDLLAKVERMACPHIGMRIFHLKETERGVLEQDIERLRSQFAAGTGADAEIFAAFDRWADLVRDCCAAKADEDVERLSELADAAALNVMSYEPATREGLAAQVYLMLHLEHGGAAPNHLEIGFSSLSNADHADGAAVHALVERIKRMGRPGGGAASQDLPTSLYARWAEARARYLADDDKTEEELEALEDELDRLEDRLESEPVRCVADAVAKLGYFLTVSNTMLNSGQMPNLNPRLSSPVDRILATVEDESAVLPETMREPFQALAAGLRQLMQRHVKLAGEAERAVDAYQLPDEVSRAMQAVCARNVAASAEAYIRNPGPGEELRHTFRGLDSANRKRVMALAPFMAVSAHLNDAMLAAAREHGVIGIHRAWLEGELAGIPAEGGTVREGGRFHVGPVSEGLQQAWGELVALDAQVETLPPEALENGAYDAIAEQARATAGRILAAPATTILDMEILTRFALRALILYFGIDEAQVRGWFAEGTLPVDNERESVAALWRAAEGLRNLADTAPAANDQHHDADAFADTVAAFEAEAPATLALPLEPTGRMVDAGASAAGITPAQFQAAYAAAVEALKLERAA